MKILELLGELIIIYILYKVIFDFIIPVYQTTKQVKSKMGEMQERMREQQRAQAAPQYKFEGQRQPQPQQAKASSDDYIDYEEVK
jgi:sortase (surface protein transpeptidase)